MSAVGQVFGINSMSGYGHFNVNSMDVENGSAQKSKLLDRQNGSSRTWCLPKPNRGLTTLLVLSLGLSAFIITVVMINGQQENNGSTEDNFLGNFTKV